jgi:ribonucleoside-diphosphate reductase alpha chain
LKKYVPNGVVDEKEKCPNCGEKLVFEDGCKHCKSCGYSKCG